MDLLSVQCVESKSFSCVAMKMNVAIAFASESKENISCLCLRNMLQASAPRKRGRPKKAAAEELQVDSGHPTAGPRWLEVDDLAAGPAPVTPPEGILVRSEMLDSTAESS